MTRDKRPADSIALPRLGLSGTLRWWWRQLTSMRTALFLLLLLAVAAVPGSIFPQRAVNSAAVSQYLSENPDLAPWLDKLQLFDVFSSVWFSAIYLLLFISLIGCVIPRGIAHFKAWRTKPPLTPRRLSRLPEYGTVVLPPDSGISARTAATDAATILKRRGYRVDLRDPDGDRPSVGAERGFLKELGNVVFHTALIGVLVSVAVGGLFGYRGQKILVEGDGGFVNTLIGYDSFTPGTNFNASSLTPFSTALDSFQVTFDRSKTNYGQPIDFTAAVTVRDSLTAGPEKRILKVNEPIDVAGTGIFLVGNGYAPVVTVKDGKGNVASSGPVVSLPSGPSYTSQLVIKVPDAQPSQLAFVGFFLPTAVTDKNGLAVGSDPDPLIPRLYLNSFYGDLGLNNGTPRNVYTLDVKGLTQLNGRNLPARGIVLAPGQSYTLPQGKGSISFDGIKRYIGVDIRRTPGQLGVLVSTIAALIGLVLSLYVARRRVWVRTGSGPDGRTMVEYGLLARGEDHRLGTEKAKIGQLFEQAWMRHPGSVQREPSGITDARRVSAGSDEESVVKDR